jgi:mono/diheme cytochrome c family protein
VGRNGLRFVAWLIVALLVSACNSHTEIPTDAQRFIDDGRPLYVEHCAGCHQEDGAGQPGKVPKLAGNPIVTLEDPIPIIDTVVQGKGSMPGFGDQLDDVQIADILSYIRNTWGNKAPAVSNRQIP